MVCVLPMTNTVLSPRVVLRQVKHLCSFVATWLRVTVVILDGISWILCTMALVWSKCWFALTIDTETYARYFTEMTGNLAHLTGALKPFCEEMKISSLSKLHPKARDKIVPFGLFLFCFCIWAFFASLSLFKDYEIWNWTKRPLMVGGWREYGSSHFSIWMDCRHGNWKTETLSTDELIEQWCSGVP